MAATFKTPGVFIEEQNAFPNSVVPVETAVPAFIGYTEKASRNGKSLLNKPLKISSLAEYHEFFGGPFKAKFELLDTLTGTPESMIDINGAQKTIRWVANQKALLYPGICLFYANGGHACYIVSVGNYADKEVLVIDQEELLGTKKGEDGKVIEGGLHTLLKEEEPTMIVIPDAVTLGEGCYSLYQEVLRHCGSMQNRVALLDVFDGFQKGANGNTDFNSITKFRNNTGTEFLDYGAAYYPWLQCSIFRKEEVTFDHLNLDFAQLAELLPETQAVTLISEFQNESEVTENKKQNLDLGLRATSGTYLEITVKICAQMNLLPPSAAMAGICTMVDTSRGVWKAPANVSLNSVTRPAVSISHDDQEKLNTDPVSGKSINAIRTFPGVGTLVWGARTLNGNSMDGRYVNVRRTMIMLEQSIKLALRSLVFEKNDAQLWATARSMVTNFLTEMWKQGALAGASPADAFNVQAGLGSTMTANDILYGILRVSVHLAVMRPAEFMVVTFEQQMQPG